MFTYCVFGLCPYGSIMSRCMTSNVLGKTGGRFSYFFLNFCSSQTLHNSVAVVVRFEFFRVHKKWNDL